MNGPACGFRGGPPWRSEGRWGPTRHDWHGNRGARIRFFRRAGVAALVLLGLAAWGVFTLATLAAARFGIAGAAAAVAVIVLLVVAAFLLVVMLRALRGFASPLGAVMEAADRVAGGEYGVRVRESGPPPIRGLVQAFNTMTERLQHADRLRRNLMADVAHELRTPLSVLQGRLEGLIDGVYPRDDQQLTRLLEETHVLSRLTDDLRTLALSDAGALPLEKESTDIADLVQQVVGGMQPEAVRSAITVSTVASPDLPAVEVDPLRIREVLTNLLSNAIRHSSAGGAVTVTVGRAGDGVAIAVRDTGEGISADAVDRIFDRFYKGTASRGSGLGLTIAKGIVSAHGGEIHASSTVGGGTTITFTLPARQSAS